MTRVFSIKRGLVRGMASSTVKECREFETYMKIKNIEVLYSCMCTQIGYF